MNAPIPPFLQRLALGADADVRAIRRAYARELKLIDQAADLHGFQLLRDYYEAALAWAAHEEREPAQLQSSMAPVQAPMRPAEPIDLAMNSVDPTALAAAVYDRLSSAGRLLEKNGLGEDALRWQEELRLRLNDDELHSISARELFEELIVRSLSGAWALRSASLLGAGIAVFDWENDRRRLKQFGPAGALVDRIVDERVLFRAQDGAELIRQRKVMARMRADQNPSLGQEFSELLILERMLSQYPRLMAICISETMIARWRTQCRPINNDEHVKKHRATPVLIIGLMLILAVVFAQSNGMMDGLGSAPVATEVAAQPSAEAAVSPQFQAIIDGPQPERQRPMVWATADQAYFGINHDIAYTPGPNVSAGELRVDLNVLAEPNGRIYGSNILGRSRDPKFDQAVEAAIMRSPPLAKSLGETLYMQFSYTVKR